MAISEIKIFDNVRRTNFTYKHQLLINTQEKKDEYFFMNDNLQRICGKQFKFQDIEITHAFGRTLEFSLITADKNLTLTCNFVSNENLQLFFSQQRESVLLQVRFALT